MAKIKWARGFSPLFERRFKNIKGTLMKSIQKDLRAWFITFVTHNTRHSERMRKHNVILGKPVIFSESQEIEMTKYILQIKQENNLQILAYNICRDHVHMVLVCEETERDNIVRKIKGKSAYLYKANNNVKEQLTLWAQKYNYMHVENEEILINMCEYVIDNRIKHNLSSNKGLQPLLGEMLCTIEEAFSQVEGQGAKAPCLSEYVLK